MKGNKQQRTSVDTEKLLVSLEEVATKIGVQVRYETIAGGPVKSTYGSCRIRGDEVILIDRRLSTLEKAFALGKELSRFELEEIFISPAARKFIEYECEE